MDRRSGRSDGGRGFARREGTERYTRPARQAGSVLSRADLCAGQRLLEKLERRYRGAGQGRTGDRRNRSAGSRSAAVAGAGRSREPGGERKIIGSDADAAEKIGRASCRERG